MTPSNKRSMMEIKVTAEQYEYDDNKDEFGLRGNKDRRNARRQRDAERKRQADDRDDWYYN